MILGRLNSLGPGLRRDDDIYLTVAPARRFTAAKLVTPGPSDFALNQATTTGILPIRACHSFGPV
jgi:hypothetical protein